MDNFPELHEYDNETLRTAYAFALSLIIVSTVLFFSAHSFNIASKKIAEAIPIEVTRTVIATPPPPESTPAPPIEKPLPKNAVTHSNIVRKDATKKEPDPPAPEEVAPTPAPQAAQDFTVPTVEAEPVEEIKPEIPYELRTQEYKSSVRVKVEVNTDGSSVPTLKTSSGNDQIDNQVLIALKKWRWHPGLLNGQPVKSVRYFKFEFEVR